MEDDGIEEIWEWGREVFLRVIGEWILKDLSARQIELGAGEDIPVLYYENR